MDDIERLATAYGNHIKAWFIDLWDSFYAYLVSAMGETFAKMTVILGATGLVLFFYFSLQNRN